MQVNFAPFANILLLLKYRLCGLISLLLLTVRILMSSTHASIRRDSQLKNVPIEQLQPGRYQPRKDFSVDQLQELAQSIASAGLIQPIVIRPLAEDRYEIIAGERRWRAAQMAGLDTLPCLIKPLADHDAAAIATIENVQRQDLNPIEEAQGYHRLAEEFGYRHEEIAAIVGKSRAKISNTLRLLKLNSKIQSLLIAGTLSAGHGKVLAGVPLQRQSSLAEEAVTGAWSVRKLEQEIQKPIQETAAIRSQADPHLARLEQLASDQFGAEVKLADTEQDRGGWLKIRYFDNETLAGLLDKLGIEYD